MPAPAVASATTTQPAKVLICGSRHYNPRYRWLVEERVAKLEPGTLIIAGGATGVDTWAEEAALEHHLPVKIMKPDWTRGRRGGYERNMRMLDEGPGLVIAYWDGLSRGTLHTVTEAIWRGIPIEQYDKHGDLMVQG